MFCLVRFSGVDYDGELVPHIWTQNKKFSFELIIPNIFTQTDKLNFTVKLYGVPKNKHNEAKFKVS